MRMVGPNCMGVLNTDPVDRIECVVRGTPAASRTHSARLAERRPRARSVEPRRFTADWTVDVREPRQQGGHLGQRHSSVCGARRRRRRSCCSIWSRSEIRAGSASSRGACLATKPIVVVKSGRTAAGLRAAASHTAGLAASELAVDGLFQQAGVIRADTIDEMFDVAACLDSQPLPRRPAGCHRHQCRRSRYSGRGCLRCRRARGAADGRQVSPIQSISSHRPCRRILRHDRFAACRRRRRRRRRDLHDDRQRANGRDAHGDRKGCGRRPAPRLHRQADRGLHHGIGEHGASTRGRRVRCQSMSFPNRPRARLAKPRHTRNGARRRRAHWCRSTTCACAKRGICAATSLSTRGDVVADDAGAAPAAPRGRSAAGARRDRPLGRRGGSTGARLRLSGRRQAGVAQGRAQDRSRRRAPSSRQTSRLFAPPMRNCALRRRRHSTGRSRACSSSRW